MYPRLRRDGNSLGGKSHTSCGGRSEDENIQKNGNTETIAMTDSTEYLAAGNRACVSLLVGMSLLMSFIGPSQKESREDRENS